MKRRSWILFSLVAACAPAASRSPRPIPVAAPAPPPAARSTAAPRPPWAAEYPPARVTDVHELHHGIDIADPYRWMEDGASADVRAWTETEDALTRRHLDALPARAAIATRLHDLLYVDAREAPVPRGKRLFFTARAAAQEKSVLFWRGADGKDHVLLDPNTWPSRDNPSLQLWVPSLDGSRVAYAVSLHNADEATLHVVDVATGIESPRDAVPDLFETSVSWAGDSKSFYYRYSPRPPAGVPVSDRNGLTELRWHKLGDDPAHDVVVHEKTGDPKLWLDGFASHDGHWLFALIYDGERSTKVQFRDLRRKEAGPSAGWRTLVDDPRVKAQVDAYRDRFYVMTNDAAPSWRMFAVDPAHEARAAWKEIVPERRDARLQDFALLGGRLVLRYFKDVVTHLEVHALGGALEREIPLPALGTADLPSGEPDADEAYFAFSSYTYPIEIEHATLAKGASSTWYRSPAPVDLSKLEVEQVFYPSKDGTRIPMFLVHAKGMKRDGTTPAMIGGYGGFDITYSAEYAPTIVPWLERGGLYAWPGLRGGGEYGEEWHRAGMLHAKQNVFDDFAAAVEWLVHEGYTRTDRVVATGRSNGGLLMGAMLTERPDLFRAILCGAPLLDMIRYPKAGAGKFWLSEYGDPEDEDDFRALYAYSPLHHVKTGERYPAVLLVSPIDDDRVDPMHARKLAAALQQASSGGPVLFRVERNAGHGGADARGELASRYADQLAFALAEVARVGGSMTGL